LKTALGNLIYPRVLPSHSLTVICKSLKRAYKRYLLAASSSRAFTLVGHTRIPRVVSADTTRGRNRFGGNDARRVHRDRDSVEFSSSEASSSSSSASSLRAIIIAVIV